MNENPKVFISYSHQTQEHENKVLEFANKLRSEGIDAIIDLYEESPAEGWPRWMENQIKNSDYVLLLCDKSYSDKFYSDEKGKGLTWEVNIVYQLLYDSCVETKKFIPVLFDGKNSDYIPTPIKSFTYYNINTEYDKLYWRLRGVSKTEKPPLGDLRPLPEKERKTMFFSTPIDVEKWNSAKWKGAIYMFLPGPFHPPVLGILFEEYSAGKEIFSEWRKISKENFADEFIRIDFITPLFPDDCWVNSEENYDFGVGYFIHIGPNLEQSMNRGIDSGIEPEEIMLATISRYQWMGELNGPKSRERFKKIIEGGSSYFLLPIDIKDLDKTISEDNLIIDFDFAIKMKKAYFTEGKDITDQDIYSIVLEKPSNE